MRLIPDGGVVEMIAALATAAHGTHGMRRELDLCLKRVFRRVVVQKVVGAVVRPPQPQDGVCPLRHFAVDQARALRKVDGTFATSEELLYVVVEQTWNLFRVEIVV